MKLNRDDPVIGVEWLKDHIRDTNLVLVDCRYDLQDKNYGYNSYLKGHLPKAIFLDLEKDLASKDIENRGRHPFPPVEKFKETLESSGIDGNSMVIAYDDDNSGAARFWFLMRYYSMDNVFVLNGGISAWTKAGGMITREIPEKRWTRVNLVERKDLIASKEEIASKKNIFLIDARAPERYEGKVEPIDPVAGHIPEAHNIFWKNFLNPDNTYKEKEEVRKMLKTKTDNIVLYCGSGVTSCVNYVAMLRSGLTPRLYPGGWSEWVTNG